MKIKLIILKKFLINKKMNLRLWHMVNFISETRNKIRNFMGCSKTSHNQNIIWSKWQKFQPQSKLYSTLLYGKFWSWVRLRHKKRKVFVLDWFAPSQETHHVAHLLDSLSSQLPTWRTERSSQDTWNTQRNCSTLGCSECPRCTVPHTHSQTPKQNTSCQNRNSWEK